MPTNSDFEAKLRTFTAKRLSSLRSIIQVCLLASSLPLRFSVTINYYRRWRMRAGSESHRPSFQQKPRMEFRIREVDKGGGLSSQTKCNTKIRCWGEVDKGAGQGKSLRTPAFALKGRNEIAQGNALGESRHKTPSPERAKDLGCWLFRPFRAYLMDDCYPGLRSAPPRAITFHPFGA